MNESRKNEIVFTSGVFDILHAGHVEFLKKAKDLVGEKGKLIVAIHDDKSVRQLKGNDRPINTLEDRITVLEAVKFIDEIISWQGWENIEKLVREIKPDFIAVAGDEYKSKTIASVADNIGAKLVVYPINKGLSTTKICGKIRALG